MTELKLTSKHSGSLQPLTEGAISEALRSAEAGIQLTAQRLRDFEEKHQIIKTESTHLSKSKA